MSFGQRASAPVDVFIVDADPGQRRALGGFISERALGRFQARLCASPAEAMAAAGDGAIIVADLETIGGLDRLNEMVSPANSLIATSTISSLSTAVAAVKAGAVDFLPKPIGAKALLERLEHALSAIVATPRRVPAEAPQPRPAAPARAPVAGDAGFIGAAPAMLAVYEQIRRMAPSRAPVFVTGESGTGKELCAEAIHAAAGGRPDRPFVAINCSAIPRDLMESEIFGHVRGAFTGAAENRPGAAELADGGTLFLDEIAEMDLGLQAKLLRFIQTGTIRRVGGSELKRVDVRFVCATNRDPFAEVEAGRFRGDLFYRLHVLPIHLPPLRDRPEDVLPLAKVFLARYAAEEGRAFASFDPATAAILSAYPWPGNVRQLQNVIRRIVVLHDAVDVTPEMLPASFAVSSPVQPTASAAPAPPAASTAPHVLPFWREEQRIIEAALAAYGGSISRAAAALDISPSTIYRKRQSWAGRLDA